MNQPVQKKTPVRQCLGCNEHKSKAEMLRILRSPEGTISLDRTGRKSGRGAYICNDIACLRKARKTRRAEHLLNCSIPDDVWQAMELEISDHD